MKIVKSISTVMLLCLFSLSMTVAQNKTVMKDGQKREAKIVEMQEKKVKKLVTKLELTDTEKARFVPLYEKYQGEKMALRAMRKDDRGERGDKKMSELSDADLERIIQNSFDVEESQLALKRKYHNEFKSILPMNKVAKLYFLEKRHRDAKGEKGGINKKGNGKRNHKKVVE